MSYFSNIKLSAVGKEKDKIINIKASIEKREVEDTKEINKKENEKINKSEEKINEEKKEN